MNVLLLRLRLLRLRRLQKSRLLWQFTPMKLISLVVASCFRMPSSRSQNRIKIRLTDLL